VEAPEEKVHTTGQQMNQFKKFNKGRISKQKKTDFSRPFESEKRWVVLCQTLRPSARPPYSDEEIIPFLNDKSRRAKMVSPSKVSGSPRGYDAGLAASSQKYHRSGTGKTLRESQYAGRNADHQIHENYLCKMSSSHVDHD
jgi:hypothetical protein